MVVAISEENPMSSDAIRLMEELSDTLEAITGRNGKNSFCPDDVRVPRSVFVIARNEEGEAIGCGAIRLMDEHTAEVKRMYAKTQARGVGTRILTYLENKARMFGYSDLWLETGIVNRQAVAFYESRGYLRIPNYGKYVDFPDSVCFGKRLIEA